MVQTLEQTFTYESSLKPQFGCSFLPLCTTLRASWGQRSHRSGKWRPEVQAQKDHMNGIKIPTAFLNNRHLPTTKWYCVFIETNREATQWLFSLFTFQSAVVWRVINHVSISSQKAPDTLIIPYSCVFSHNNLALSCKDSPACDLCVWVLEGERRKASRNTATPLLVLWLVFCFLQSFILVSMLYLFISSLWFPRCVCQSRRPYIALY